MEKVASAYKSSNISETRQDRTHAELSSTPAVRQSAEDDRSAVLNGQLWSSVFCCCGPVDVEFAARQSS